MNESFETQRMEDVPEYIDPLPDEAARFHTSRDLNERLLPTRPEPKPENEEAPTIRHLRELDPGMAAAAEKIYEKFGDRGLRAYANVMRALYVTTAKMLDEAAPAEFASEKERNAYLDETIGPLAGLVSGTYAAMKDDPEFTRGMYQEIFTAGAEFIKQARRDALGQDVEGKEKED